MKSLFFLAALLMTCLCLGAPPATRPTTAVDQASCVTLECHTKIKASKVTHGPVASNTCDACHESKDVAQHTFVLRRTNADTCTYCHEFSVVGMPLVHKPVADGQCLGCHDPHGGETHAILKEATTAELCGRCHESITKNKSSLHTPVAQGACDSCHPPHASKFPKLLDAVGTDLCLTCHKELEPKLAQAKFTHKVLKDGCEKCHDVHGSNVPLALHKPANELCFDCHKHLQERITKAIVKHEPVIGGRPCITCHTPHAGDFQKLTLDSPAKMCLKCHDKPIKLKDRTIGAVKEVADAKMYKHGELKEGQCGGCHTTHGGNEPGLLQKAYSSGFYQKFSAESFELCFACHDKRLATEAATAVTGFRNGTQNLHLVHASQGTRDKNCRACHTMHASGNDRLIRDILPYGTWDMPMRFHRTETGGSCFPGCHREFAYDRVTPVPPTTAPATLPSTKQVDTIARAINEDDQIIQWTARDYLGNNLTIPDRSHPGLLVFLPDDSVDAANMLKSVRPAIADTPVQVIVVASGLRSEADIDRINSVLGRNWSLVLDPAGEAMESLRVRAHPMVIVLRPDGSQVVRLSGRPAILNIKLQAYVDLAAGKRPSTQATTAPATHPLIEDPAKRLARDMRLLHRLLEERKPDEALSLIEQFDASSRKTPEVMCAKAEAMIQLKKPGDALAVLDAIGPVKNSTVEELLARVRAWILLKEWNRARAILEQDLARFPDSAAGHELLGSIYEHDQQWQHAAEQYRKANELRTGLNR